MKNAYDVIIAPVVTEKNNAMIEESKYVFKVDTRAEKIEIGRAIEELFNVKVKSVNVMNYNGKPKRAARSSKMGRRANWKKAIVTLAEGSIDLF
ncbi:MAG: 50S ribosomal protein L23 [Lentisphaerae bacterium]|nr:50S ribosomal protein L23 [Lentisphaerota bacterium]MCP4101242.1 50S ribosomal protein L23 [Lentisphaerota bacterium]